MLQIGSMEELLKKYKLYKERAAFLEKHLEGLAPETHKDFIEYRMFSSGYTGTAPKFIMEDEEEVAELNKVESTAFEYREKCEREYHEARNQIESELSELRYCISIIEDGLDTIERIDSKYRTIIERYYVKGNRIEDIAHFLGMSRSGCYKLCKESIKQMERLIFGERDFLKPLTD